MKLPPRTALLGALVASSNAVSALETRDYDESELYGVRKWLHEMPGIRVYNHPPYINPNFTSFDPTKLRAVGWPEHATDWTRQLALISPRHAIYATHYTLDGANGLPITQINYLGSDGLQHLVQIQSQAPILDTLGQTTDLLLITLSAPVVAPGVIPYKVLNLPNEAAYVQKPLLVCGRFVVACTSELQGFSTNVFSAGAYTISTTRTLNFDYDRSATTDTVRLSTYQSGDSGGPVFVMENGELALVGTASATYDLTPNDGPYGNGPAFRNHAGFVPAYLPQLDALMEATGYHIKRFYPAATSLSSLVTPAGTLRQLMPGSIAISTANSGAATADNVTLDLTFSEAPATVSGVGWICEATSPLTWKCRRGGISLATTASLSATFGTLSQASILQVTAVQLFDGGSPITTITDLPLTPSYAAWVNGASDTAFTADPDGDGIQNLMEYASGGSAAQSSLVALDGRNLLPQASHAGGNLVIRIPKRSDSQARGLMTTVEFSDTAHFWNDILPPGGTLQTEPCVPPSPGFEVITVTLPVTSPKYFVRAKVNLTE